VATKKELLEKLDKIDDEELARMLALVAYRENQEELDQLLQSEEYTPPDELEMRAFQEKFHKDSQRALHRSKSRVIRWACGIAAAAVFAFAVPISADNVTIFQLVAQVFTDYSDISTLDGYTFEKPEEWDCEYYPTWIPEEYAVDEIFSFDYSHTLYFVSDDNSSFIFSYVIEWSNDYSAIEQEGLDDSIISIHGDNFPVYSNSNGKKRTVYIGTGNGTIIIEGELTLQQLTKIAKSINGLM